MAYKTVITILVCGIVLSILVVRQGKAQMTVPIPVSPHPNVHIKRGSEDTFFVSNEDPRDIIGICALWTIVDQSGESTTATQMADRFQSRLNSSIIPANGKLILGPQGLMAVTPAMSSMGNGAGTGMADRIKQAQSVTVSIDAIIFQDGELWGPNLHRTDDEIVQRKLAATDISQVARQTMASGGDLKAALEAVKSAPYPQPYRSAPSPQQYRAKWRQQWAIMLLMEPDPQRAEKRIEYFEALPEPIAFTARQ